MPTFYSSEFLESLPAETIDTDRLNELAKPQKSFYGKAHIVRTLENDKGTVTCGYHLISYSTHVASAYITNTRGHCLLNLTMRHVDEYATSTTRRHLRAFSEVVAGIARSDIICYQLNTCTVHIAVNTKRTVGQILPLKNRASSFSSTLRNEDGTELIKAVRTYVTSLLRQYPLPQTVRKYERADECKRLFWNYSEYAYSVRTYDKDESADALISESAYERL